MGSSSKAENDNLSRRAREADTVSSRRREPYRGKTVMYVDFAMPVGYRAPVQGLVRWLRDNPSQTAMAARSRRSHTL